MVRRRRKVAKRRVKRRRATVSQKGRGLLGTLVRGVAPYVKAIGGQFYNDRKLHQAQFLKFRPVLRRTLGIP